MKTKLRHTLVQYHGGGYDGCFWEWNFFYIDAEGEFHCIEATGRAGCDTAEKADAMLADDDGHVYAYDVTHDYEIAAFAKESNAVHVLGVLNWFNEYNTYSPENIEFFAICTECGGHITWGNDGEAMLESWHGCGGIASTADDLLCSDCYSMGTCGVCNEYVGQSAFEFEQDVDDCSPETIEILADFVEDDGPACQWCWENERDSLINSEHGDMLSVSLATGAPDLFSDEMNWFWRS